MAKFLLKLISLLVSDPTTVSIQETLTPNITTLDVTVLPTEYGRVIGKDGKIIRSIRSLLTLKGLVENKQVLVRLIEPPLQN